MICSAKDGKVLTAGRRGELIVGIFFFLYSQQEKENEKYAQKASAFRAYFISTPVPSILHPPHTLPEHA